MNPLLAASESTGITEVLNIIPKIGVAALLIIIIYGGFRQWWVFSWTYNELLSRHEKLREDRDRWQEIALRASNLAELLADKKKDVK